MIFALAIGAFILAGLFTALGCTNQQKVYWNTRAWRYRRPESCEPSDAAYSAQRAGFFVTAVFMVVAGGGLLGTGYWLQDLNSWDEAELRQTAQDTAAGLRKLPTYSGDRIHTYDVEEELNHGAGKRGPRTDLDVSQSGEQDFTISAKGVHADYCLAVSQGGETGSSTMVPGSDDSTINLPEHELDTDVSRGSC